jgi:molecular chaperone HscB
MSAAAAKALRFKRVQYFELFGLKPAYRLDTTQLTLRLFALQTEVHPDKFVNEPESARRVAQQRSALVNDAYGVLADPVSRAAYLIENIYGENPLSEKKTKMPLAFLEQQLELREALEQHRKNKNSEALVAMLDELERAEHTTETALAVALDDEANMERASIEVRKLRFQQKLLEEINAEIG